MSSLFHDLAFFKNYDGVCVFHRGKPVGDEEDGSAFTELFERVLNAVLGDIIQGRCCFIENQYGRVFQEQTSDSDPLLLPAGKLNAPLSNVGIVAIGQARDEVVDLRFLRCLHNLFFCGIGPAVEDIVPNGSRKEEDILLDQTYGLPGMRA